MLSFFIATVDAQTTAMDFTMNDCNGNMHNLYSELDQNRVVILEFFMLNCSPCIAAAHQIDPLYQQLNSTYNNHLSYYTFGYDDTYLCADISNWVSVNGFSAIPFDSGAYQVAYYGGFGMPTIVVVGGAGHDVIYNSVGYTSGDTSLIHTAIQNYFAAHPVGVDENFVESNFSLFPNPAAEKVVSSCFDSQSEIDIYNVFGKLIQQNIPSANHTIDVSNIPNGIYFIHVASNTNQIIQKLIVNH